MDLNADFYTGVLSSLIALLISFITIKKANKLNSCAVFNHLFNLLIILILVLEFLCLNERLSYFKMLDYTSVVLTTLASLILVLICVLTIDEFQPKKMRTLWRIPIIGFLLGFLVPEHLFTIHLGIYFITAIVFFYNKEKLRILLPSIMTLGGLSLSIYFVRNQNFWYLNLVLILYIFFTFRLWNMGHIKFLMWEKRD